ncbi:MAG: hypothetical protein AB8B55_10170 [Mariniblastus sp.]
MKIESSNNNSEKSVGDNQPVKAEVESEPAITPKPPVKHFSASKDVGSTNPYFHLIALAFGYALILFLATCGLDQSPVSAVFLFPTIISTAVLTAIWSVLGPGNYFQRLFWSHVVGLIPMLGALFGFIVISLSHSFIDGSDILNSLLYGLLFIPPLSLATQLPFWFFRGFFGWQLVLGEAKPQLPFNLKDIFAITFLFALSFSVPSIAYNLQSASVGNMYVSSYETVVAAMIWIFIATCFCVPVLLFVYRTQERASGCAYTAMYAFGLALIPLSLLAIFSGGGAELGEVVFYFLLSAGLSGGGLAVPMAISRETGFVLTSPKRHARVHGYDLISEKVKSGANLDETKPVDPFAD